MFKLTNLCHAAPHDQGGGHIMRMMVEAALLLLFAILFLLMAALAVKAQPAPQQAPAATAQPAPPEVMDEIIVRGRRNEPDFQEEWQHHREEYNRLRKIYGPPEVPNRRLDRMTDTPNPDAGKSVMRSPGSTVTQGRPTPGIASGEPATRF